MPPDVAICVVTHNNRREIGPALADALAQDTSVEVHVWDNASRDGTAAEVAKSADIHLHRSPLNLGFCAANNRLIDATTAPFVLFLNPDTVLQPGCVARLRDVLAAAEPGIAAVGPKLVKPDGHTIDSAGMVLSLRNLSPHDRGEGEPDRGQYDQPGPTFGPSFACALWRREAIEALRLRGQFLDEDFFAYFEDVDVAWRAARLGWRFLYEPGAVCKHRRGRPDAHGPTLAARAFVNRHLLAIANAQRAGDLWRLAPRELARLTWKCLRVRGFGIAWRMLRQSWRGAWHKRRLLVAKARG